jgi:lysophospholipid acyltransferase (LPLAT)-like uncharacterized protein
MKIKWLKPVLTLIVPWVGAFYSQLVGRTSSFRMLSSLGLNYRHEFFALSKDSGVIYACWHSRFFYLSYFGRETQTVTMISASHDGELITRVINKMGLGAVRGSSSKNGEVAFDEALECLNNKKRLLMIPDGPRGPRYKAKWGVIRLAQASGCPIVPLHYSSTKGIFFSSWDHFFLPLPFGKGVLSVGDPIYVPATLTPQELQQYTEKLEQAMTDGMRQADLICNRNPDKEVKPRKKKNKPVTKN